MHEGWWWESRCSTGFVSHGRHSFEERRQSRDLRRHNGQVQPESKRLPARCFLALGRRRGVQLLAFYLCLRTTEHRNHWQGHAEWSKRQRTLVAMERTSGVRLERRQEQSAWGSKCAVCDGRKRCSGSGTHFW